MRKFLHFIVMAVLFNACTKDTLIEKYSFYKPVYKTKQEVIAAIQSAAPVEIKQTGKLFIKDQYVFLNEPDKGVHIIDFSNPSNPVNKAFIHIPGNVDLAVRGNTLYADCYTDLIAIDISNPLQVVTKKVVEGVFPHRRYYNFTADTNKIIVEWIRIDTTIERTANDWNFQQLYPGIWLNDAMSGGTAYASPPSVNGVGGSMARFALLNNRMYTVGDSYMKVFNTTNPNDPVMTNGLNLPSWRVETIFPFKQKLFIGSQTGMFIYNVNNPDQPVKEGTFEHVTVCDPVIADDNFAYVTLRTGTTCAGIINQLEIVSIQNINAPSLVKTYPMTNPHGLSKDGNLLFICDGTAGLKIYNAASVNNLSLIKTIPDLETFDVIAYNGIALTVAKTGIYFIDYSNPSDIKIKGSLTIKQQ